MVWYSHLFQNFPVCCDSHKGFSIVNKAEIDIFLELSYFFYDPMDVGNLISGSSAFPKSSLNIWKFLYYGYFIALELTWYWYHDDGGGGDDDVFASLRSV